MTDSVRSRKRRPGTAGVAHASHSAVRGASGARRAGACHEARRDARDRGAEPPRSLGLKVVNDTGELERIAAAVDDFADRHRFPDEDRFQIQLCVEESFLYIVEHGYEDAAARRIEILLEMDVKDRRLAIRTVDAGRELEPVTHTFQPGANTIQEETVIESLGLNLVRTYVDDLKYRRENGRNSLTSSKKIGG